MSQSPLVTVDYLRISTFDFKAYTDLTAILHRKYVGWRKSRWLQYSMMRSQDNVGYGLAEQNKKPHGIVEASGVDAHILFNFLMTQDNKITRAFYGSRIDLQCTQKPPRDWSYLESHKRLAKPKQLILGDDGNTLYIGNRQSDTFWRIYDKTDGEVRVEVELKNKQAKRAWLTLLNGQSPRDIYNLYLKKSRVPSMMATHYANGIDPMNEDDLARVVPVDLETTFLWLASLDKLVYKMANDHDFAERMGVMLKRWAEYTQKP